MKIKVSILFLVLLGVFGCDEHPEAFDLSMSAEKGGDITAVLGGCGGTFRSGYLFCRLREGALPTDKIVLKFPKIDCKRENCIEFRFFRKDGSVGHTQGIKARQTQAVVPLHKIVGTEQPLSMDEDGEYLLQVRAWFLDNAGYEHNMIGEGLIRVFIVREGYVVIGCNSPERGWEERVGSCFIEHSTGYRTAVCGECK